MRRGVRARVFGLALGLALIGCGEPGEAGEHEAGEGGERHHESATRWVPVERPRDASVLELPARIVAAPDSQAHIDAPLRGTVVGVSVRVGDRVEAGDALVELRIPEVLEAIAVLAGTGAQIGSHKDRRDRLDELEGKGLVGAGEVFEIESDLGRLSAERRLALATLAAVGVAGSERREVASRGTVLFTAPITGVVSMLDAAPGEVVEPGEGLVELLGRAPARVEVRVAGAGPDPALVAGAQTELVFHGLDGSELVLGAEPVASAVEPALGRTLVWYEPADPELRLADGVRGRVVLASDDPTLFEVPRGALRLDEGRAFVGRRPADEGGEIEMVEVEVLRSVGTTALIRSEALGVGDQIAADAATVLRLGREPGELGGGGHHH